VRTVQLQLWHPVRRCSDCISRATARAATKYATFFTKCSQLVVQGKQQLAGLSVHTVRLTSARQTRAYFTNINSYQQ
jgi:hypothetical protein